MKYKVTYYKDKERKVIDTMVIETTQTQEQLLQHFHIIAVELIKETKPKK